MDDITSYDVPAAAVREIEEEEGVDEPAAKPEPAHLSAREVDKPNRVDAIAAELLAARAAFSDAKDRLQLVKLEIAAMITLPAMSAAASEVFDERYSNELVGARTKLVVTTPVKIHWDQHMLRELVEIGIEAPDYVKTTLNVRAPAYRKLTNGQKRMLDPAAQPYHGNPSVEVILHD